jgi:hypothetical protein
MAEFKLGRIRFVWKNDWVTGTVYYKDDVVKFGGKTYICVQGHTSAVNFYTDVSASPTRWNQFTDGQFWKAEWNTSTEYKINDIVKYGGLLYICRIGHTSASTATLGLENDLDLLDSSQSKWDLFGEGFDWKDNWNISTRYKKNDLVRYGGYTYVCNEGHVSAGTVSSGLEADQSKWDEFNEGIEYKGDWNSGSVRYKINDVVKYGAGLWICVTQHTSSGTFQSQQGNWNSFVNGIEFEEEWNSSTVYQPGDIVRYGGNQYISKTHHSSQIPATSTANWSLFSEGFNFVSDWNSSTAYRIGDVIRLNGFTYLATANNSNQEPPNTSFWQRLNSGIFWRGEWADDVEYKLGDAVFYGVNTYICILGHRSEEDDGSSLGAAANSRPDQDSDGVYWNILSLGSQTSVFVARGDLVYYSGSGPARLPVGIEGQVLRAGEQDPEWVTLGKTDHTYFVATHGTDLPAPVHGLSIDKPWASIRYACEQVEQGPRNPNAKKLLELNRIFIQREVTEWIQAQISGNIAPFTSSFVYDELKCERDTGLVVDALIFDISHGGNVKSRGAALAYVNALIDSPGTYIKLAAEKNQDIAAYNYMLTVVQSVLNQQPPAVNYQILSGDNSTLIASQYIDLEIESESGTFETIVDLVSIITDAIDDGNANNIPARYSPTNLIKVSTGRYREVLPIIVPEMTCVKGDELRSTNAGPRVGTIPIEDSAYSIGSLGRLETVVGQIVLGTDVTETSGNTATQFREWPFAEVSQSDTLKKLVRTIQHKIDWELGTVNLRLLSNPTNYNTTYLAGYGDARKLISENKKFFQEEITAFIENNFPDLKYSRTKCRQDVGYIVDAIVYDLTYGGNYQSAIAGIARYDLDENESYIIETRFSSDITASVAAYTYLKSVMQSVAGNTVVNALQTIVPQYRDTAGSTAAVTFIGNNLDTIIDLVSGNDFSSALGQNPGPTYPSTTWVDSGLTSAYTTLDAQVSIIQDATIDFINSNFGSFTYDSSICRRDTGLLIDAAYFDAAFGSNFWAVQNGISFYRPQSSVVITDQLEQKIAAINFIKQQASEYLETSTTAVTRSNQTYDEIIDILRNGVVSADAIVYTDPGVDANALIARQNLVNNRSVIIDEGIAWINSNFPSLIYDEQLCRRDIGYTVDALAYDAQYGGNLATKNVMRSLFNQLTGLSVAYPTSNERTAGIAFYTQLGVITGNIVQGLGGYTGQDTSAGDAGGTFATLMATLNGYISTAINNDDNDLDSIVADSSPLITWAAAGIQTAVGSLNTNKVQIVKDTLQYITNTFSDFKYNHSKCSRDVAFILEAIGYDFMFNSNFASLKSAHAYLRSTASEVFDLSQKDVTRAALSFVKDQAKNNVGGDVTVQTRIESLMTLVDDVIYGATNEGSPCASENQLVDFAVLQLERNRNYIVSEIEAWIGQTYKGTVTSTSATGNAISIDSTQWLQRNVAIRFTGATFGSLSSNTTYFVQKIISGTTFTVSTIKNANDNQRTTLTNANGSMTAELYYNQSLCLRDVNEYISALKYDLKYPGNYRSLLSARYYSNAVTGSLEEDMYYLRDGTGIRDMTLEGLSGDLLPPNEYGTSRVSAGAYCSLDPGWGPDDFRTWIITRSPYVQGVTTFGTAAIGQKIDGALHNGGNDSIVSNDFTQVISDGIGAWVANNGRAELVSVFTYYAHIGYLSTEGGRIRGTNGNNSYGDFGSVAEGFDNRETPNTGVVDNKFQFVATVADVFTNGSAMQRFEFDNAGIDYTEVNWTLTGGGISGSVLADEFRDDGVYQVRLLDLGDDSSGQFGGEGYITNSNTAQGGSPTTITIAQSDEETSSAYVGMYIILTGGTGVGQFGIINTYNSGTKVASIIKETDGSAGWQHVVPGTAIVSPDASTTYTIEPRLVFSEPPFVTEIVSAANTIESVIYGDLNVVYTGVSGSYSGTGGSAATFRVIRNGWKYIVSIQTAGIDYSRLETITIDGTDLGGTSPENDLILTITSINSITGAITAFDQDGFGAGGRFVAVGGNNFYWSRTGETWNSVGVSLGVNNWKSVTYAALDDGSSLEKISKFVAVGYETGTAQTAAYSSNGSSWSISTLPVEAQWSSVTYGNGRFVAVAQNNTTVAISLDGEVWNITSTLSSSANSSIIYGRGIFVVLHTGTSTCSTSPNGVDWTVRTLPASANWVSVAWGNNRFVAVANNSNDIAYSLDGTTWTSVTVGSLDGSSVAGFEQVRYGQGLFVTTAHKSGVENYSYLLTSEEGLIWSIKGLPEGTTDVEGYRALAFGNPDRKGYWTVIGKESGNGTHSIRLRTGVRARGRAFVADNKIFSIRILEPGSGYDNIPSMTVVDPNNLFEVPHVVRKGKGVLANPTFLNRGSQYSTGSAEVDTGDGYADNYQPGNFLAVRRLTERPVPGSNVTFSSLPGRTFKLVNVITFLGELDGSYTAFFQISPTISISEAPDDQTSFETRIRYSQVRLTGHDFLDIGTGNFIKSNYPGTPLQEPIPFNETVGNNGGRVFFTATDQDGNFRVGDLFSIEQSTGIATLNADAFNISGLQELNLGNVTLGGGSATVTEFSTDPFFTADSDNIVPTQRAVKAYIAAQIGGGGAALNVNSVTAGSIVINSNQITTSTGVPINIQATLDFRAGITGVPLAFNFFLT